MTGKYYQQICITIIIPETDFYIIWIFLENSKMSLVAEFDLC